jgi:DNA modification methylase
VELNLTYEMERELNVRLNKNSGEWDFEELQAHFQNDELIEWGFDSEELDFFEPEEEEEAEEDDFEGELPEEPKTELGRIYQLGKHRLMCGDSTSESDVTRLMDGEKADMVFTDPPYNTGMKASESDKKGEWLSHMFDDDYTDEEWETFMREFCARYDEVTSEDSFLYICLDWRRSHELVPHLKKHWKFSNLIIWDKMVHGLGSDYKYTHEFIHVCKKGKPPLANNKNGEKEYQDVWRIQRKMGRDEDHATKKPMELCARGIRHGSKKGDIVLDLFGGSGSTLIASDEVSRQCRMMELDPKYCDVIVERYCKLKGIDADEVFETGVAK